MVQPAKPGTSAAAAAPATNPPPLLLEATAAGGGGSLEECFSHEVTISNGAGSAARTSTSHLRDWLYTLTRALSRAHLGLACLTYAARVVSVVEGAVPEIEGEQRARLVLHAHAQPLALTRGEWRVRANDAADHLAWF